MKPHQINRKPCPTCPYREDTPLGIWDKTEYDKLPNYDKPTNEQPLEIFLCHQADNSCCRGWIDTHGQPTGPTELISIRLGITLGAIDPEQYNQAINEPPSTPVYKTGQEAAKKGKSGIKQIATNTQKAIDKLKRKRDGNMPRM